MFLGNNFHKSHHHFLGAFAKMPKATISFVIPFCLSVGPHWSSAPTERIFIKFDPGVFFEIFSIKFEVSWKSHNGNGHFRWRTTCMYDTKPLNSSQNADCFKDVQKIKTQILRPENRVIYETMEKNMVQPNRS